jgi:methionine sulfoxide reductase heme-binding subunit
MREGKVRVRLKADTTTIPPNGMSTTQFIRFVGKPAVFLAALVPAALLVRDGLAGDLGANPIDKITDVTGIWGLRFVLITLAVTPLRRFTGWNPLVRFRRMLGLFAFFYATLHFSTWLVLDQFFAWDFILADIAKRPFITVGFLAFVMMVPLALTSTAGWIRRLGGKRWNLLHRLIYITGVAAVLHYWWLVKVIETPQIVYAAIVTFLLAARIWFNIAKSKGTVPAAPRAIPSPRLREGPPGSAARRRFRTPA